MDAHSPSGNYSKKHKEIKQVEAEISFWSGKLALIWNMLCFLKHGTEITRSGLLCIFGQEYNFTLLLQGHINYPNFGDLPGGPGVRTLHFHWGGHGFEPWLEN